MTSITQNLPEHRGALHRTVRISVGEGAVRAVVEDDFHRFRVALRHDGQVVTAIASEGLRTPYSLCTAAGERLGEMIGLPLGPLAADVFTRIDARLQCTHQLDLAALALAAAARGTSRRYEVTVPDPVDGSTRAGVDRDGTRCMEWVVRDYAIAAPARFGGISLGAGFTDWVTRNLDPDAAEAALVLRRAVFISRGRAMLEQLDRSPHASGTGGCWVQQPERAPLAGRMVGSARSFAQASDILSDSDRAWLAFDDGSKVCG